MAHSKFFATFLLISLFTLCGWGNDTNTAKTTAKTPLNKTLGALANTSEEDEKKVFEDMVVVQKRAKDKTSKILFATHGSFDFSDGPTNVYGLHTNLGYAFNNSWELYLSMIPVFFSSERSIVKKIESLPLADNKKAEMTYAKPKSQAGLELLWLPAYGKDSWGPYHIVRSDTFFKVGVGQINYDTDKGLRFSGGLGKTYFIGNWLNFRISGCLNLMDSIVDGVKSARSMGVLEMGLVFYF